jgi:hypothetical protein
VDEVPPELLDALAGSVLAALAAVLAALPVAAGVPAGVLLPPQAKRPAATRAAAEASRWARREGVWSFVIGPPA